MICPSCQLEQSCRIQNSNLITRIHNATSVKHNKPAQAQSPAIMSRREHGNPYKPQFIENRDDLISSRPVASGSVFLVEVRAKEFPRQLNGHNTKYMTMKLVVDGQDGQPTDDPMLVLFDKDQRTDQHGYKTFLFRVRILGYGQHRLTVDRVLHSSREMMEDGIRFASATSGRISCHGYR